VLWKLSAHEVSRIWPVLYCFLWLSERNSPGAHQMGRKAGGLNYPGYVFIRQTLLAFAGNSWAGMWGDHVVFLWSVVITSRKCLMSQLKSWIFHVCVWDVALLVMLSGFLVGPWQLLNFYGPLNMSCSGHRPMLGVTDAFFFWLAQLHRRQCSFRFWLFLSALVSIVETFFWIPFSLRATHFYCVDQLFMYEVFMNLLYYTFLTSPAIP
jgi:hypothetical protein